MMLYNGKVRIDPSALRKIGTAGNRQEQLLLFRDHCNPGEILS